MRNLKNDDEDWNFAFTKSFGNTGVITNGGEATATQKASTKALNHVNEAVKVNVEEIHEAMQYYELPEGVNATDICYEVTDIIAPNVEAISAALSKTLAKLSSEVTSTGKAEACATGQAESLAFQAMDILEYALGNVTWNGYSIAEVMDVMEKDFVIAYTSVVTRACTRKGWAKANQKSGAKALDFELHKMFLYLEYGSACEGYFAKLDDDDVRTYNDGSSSSSGIGGAETNFESYGGVVESDNFNIANYMEQNHDDYSIFGRR